MAFLNPVRGWSGICGTVLALALSWPLQPARGQTVDEYKIKAAFLYKFAKFVEWPPQAFRTPADPIVICVLGRNPFGDVLDRIVAGQSVDGRSFAVRPISGEPQIAGCHILFVSSSERKRMAAIVNAAESAATLTVGETDTFAVEGGMIELRVEDGRVRLQVNLSTAEKAGLHLSSTLLSLAKIVKGGA
jgi:hypothetical protein